MSKVDLTQSKIVQAADSVHLSIRGLPKAYDGQYDYEALATGETSTNGQYSWLHNEASEAQIVVNQGLAVTDPKFIEKVLQSELSPEGTNDRDGIFAESLAAITKLPPGNVQNKLNDAAITLLYNTLPHPPATYVGPQYQFRSADGSGNNPLYPELGQSGRPYARSVQGKHPLPANVLPDPGLVFDTLLKARDFKPHPGSNSSMTFAFASLVTHSLFRTDPTDWNKNNTTSYLDLSPLYGYNQFTQDQVRNKSLGRGLLYPDTYSEERLGFVPPAASALLVIFSRNHNYIANMLLLINENGRWSDPPPTDPKALAQQDEEIFQTARLVNCGHFMALIFGDYVAGFLGLPRSGNSWSMNPFDPITTPLGQEINRGQGNHVSVEFNVLYRWHATTAQKDITWTEQEFNTIFQGKALDQVTLDDFKNAARVIFAQQEPDPKKRTFGGLKRQADGTFSDDDLANILHDATEKVAGAYRARGSPAALRVIEIMGMLQARRWGCCTMNEFRKFLGLKEFTTFEEWCSDKEIADAARKLYNHIDNLELYPGLQAEDCMALGPGSGICCGYTMTRAILADAIALVRGDRYFTHDYSPANLTSWGYQDCVRDPNNGAFGAALPKLLMRHLPRHYPANSAYSLFPFFIPSATKENLSKINNVSVNDYTFDRPIATPIPKVLNTLTGIRYVFADFEKYHQTYSYDMERLTDGYGFFLSFDDRKKHDTDKAMAWHALFPDAQTVSQYIEWYKAKTVALLKEKSFSYSGVPGKYVDIIGNVANLVGVHWAADILCGIPLKTPSTPKGLFTEQEVYQMFMVLFTCVFENVAPEHGWTLRTTASQVATIVKNFIEQSITDASPRSATNPLVSLFATVKSAILRSPPKECYPFLSKLAASGRPMRELVANVIGLAVGSSVNYSQALAQVIAFYLDDSRAKERAALIEVCKRDDPKSAELLRGYVREAMRLDPQFAGLFRTVQANDTIPQGPGLAPMNVTKGDLLFASFRNAQLNPDDFPNPTVVDPTRPKDKYQLQGAGFHGCPGVDFTADTIPQIIKIIFTLPNLKRAPAPAGTLAGFGLEQYGTVNNMYISSTGNWSPWPGSLFVTYDG